LEKKRRNVLKKKKPRQEMDEGGKKISDLRRKEDNLAANQNGLKVK